MAINVIGLINRLSPKDRGSHRLAAGVKYGPADRQLLDVYAPDHATAPLPIIIFIHGGGWNAGEPESYEFVGRSLAALGYLAVLPGYRLLPEVEYPIFLEDCAEAVRYTLDHAASWNGDPTRIALSGHSAGAYNAAMLGLVPELRRQAGLGSNLRGVACLSGPFDFFPFDGPISIRTFGAVRDPRRTQPIEHVHPGAPPFFLGTGGRDTLVFPRNTQALAKRLRAVGTSVVEHHYPKLEHALPMLALGRPARFLAPARAQLQDFFANILA